MEDGSPSSVRVAALQLCSQDNVAANLKQAEQQCRLASEAGASLIVLPEAFAFLGTEAEKRSIAESLSDPGPILTALSEWSRTLGVELIAGGLAERALDDAPPFNTSVHFSRQGEAVAAYRKMHLFDVSLSDGTSWFESRGSSRGSEPVVTSHAGYCVGLSICYDLRFPELYAWQRGAGAEILTVPAAFTRTTGMAHWHLLLRARAVETQCYVVAAAQEGTHPHGRQTFGHALIVDPWGTVVAERSDPGPGFVVFDIAAEEIKKVRQQMPLAEHRRDIAPRHWT